MNYEAIPSGRPTLIVPDRSFTAAPASYRPGIRYHHVDFVEHDRRGLRDTVVESSTLTGDHGPLIAYMHRRFGPPNLGGDPYKDLSGRWLLTTPDDDVLLRVAPSLSRGNWDVFDAYVAYESSTILDRWSLPEDVVARIEVAYRTAMIDLLRPVRVDDVPINANGIVRHDQPFCDCDKNDEPLYEVERDASAGYPIPHGMVGGDDWAKLADMVTLLGDGNAACGVSAAASAVSVVLAGKLEGETRPVRVIAHVGAVLAKREGLPLRSDDERGEALTLVEGLSSNELRMIAAVRDYDPTDVAKAAKYLRAGDVPTDLERRFEDVGNHRRFLRGWDSFWVVCGDDFPFEAIPDDRDILTVSEDLDKALREAGRPEIADWLDKLTETEEGKTVYWSILPRLFDHKDSMADSSAPSM